MLCLFCSDWYSCPYMIQHHKITEIVVFNVHAQLLSGTAVSLTPLIFGVISELNVLWHLFLVSNFTNSLVNLKMMHIEPYLAFW